MLFRDTQARFILRLISSHPFLEGLERPISPFQNRAFTEGQHQIQEIFFVEKGRL
jgi:hypothetical protein